jgi:hypothetical protein
LTDQQIKDRTRRKACDTRCHELGELVKAIRADEAAGRKYHAVARTLAHAFENRTIRAQDLSQLKAAKNSMQNTYGSLAITVMSSGGYLAREPFMVVP